MFLLFLTTLFIPFPMQMIPLYLQMKDLGLNNSLAGLVLPFLVGGFGIFLMRQAMMSIPDDLVDAARLDGASEFRIYPDVMLPLVRPALATLAVIATLWRWNDVLWPILVNSDRSLYTVTQGLAMAGRVTGDLPGRRHGDGSHGHPSGAHRLHHLPALDHPGHRDHGHARLTYPRSRGFQGGS